MEHLRPPPKLDLNTDDSTNVSEKWCQCRQTMEELYIEQSMSKESEKDKCSAFLYFIAIIGQKGRDVYNAMNLSDTKQDKIDVLFNKFNLKIIVSQNRT